MGREEIRVILLNSGKEAEFSTQLVKPLILSENWRVALTEISISSYPINFTTNESFTCEHTSNAKTRTSENFHFDEEIISSGENLISRIKSLGSKSSTFAQTVSSLRWNSISQKAELDLAQNSRIKFSPKLAAVLSFEKEVLQQSQTSQTFESKYCVDVRLHFWNLFLYSSIISPIIVGERLLPVIQSLLLEQFKKTENISKIFSPPIFLPLSKTFIPSIDIKICDELGKVLKFPKDCAIICKLLFIKNNILGGKDY